MTVVAIDQREDQIKVAVDRVWFGGVPGVTKMAKYIQLSQHAYVFCVGTGFTPQQERVFSDFELPMSVMTHDFYVEEGQTLILVDFKDKRAYRGDHSSERHAVWTRIVGPIVTFGCYENEVNHFCLGEGLSIEDAVQRVHMFWQVDEPVDFFASR